MMDKMKDMKTKKRTLKKEEKKESETEYVIRAENVDYTYEGSKIKALKCKFRSSWGRGREQDV